MFFLFGGRFAPYVRTICGIGLLTAGLVMHAVALTLIGAALAVWGAAVILTRRGAR
jgi:hypothetical protein